MPKTRLWRLLMALWAAVVLFAANPHEMLRAYLERLADRQIETHRRETDAVTTPQQARAAGHRARELLLRMIGGLPSGRGPLHLRRTRTIDRGAYRIENIIFESAPRFYVTANLYIPQTGPGPFPAVLQPTGHSTAAKARAFYQTLALGLVKYGFVVLTYDPLGQGERRIFYDAGLEDSKVGGTTVEHQMVGIQSLLAGESIARYMIWDGMRAIDVLESLPQVDAKRIGVAGCSGGGTLTAYLAALDGRLQAAAPACYISDWQDQLQGTGPQDAEQQFPDQLKLGFNHIDLLLAFAPKPYLVCSTQQDFFPLAGARRTVEAARRIYGLLGAPDRISWAVGPGGHGMPPVVRESIYGWMNHWLRDGPAGPAPERAIETEYEQNLYATSTGQVSTSLGGETASTVNMRRFGTREPLREPLRSAADVAALRARLSAVLARLTRFEHARGTVACRKDAPEHREGYTVTRMAIDVAEARELPAVLLEPDSAHASKTTLLYLDERGAGAATRPGGDAESLARRGDTVLALDLSGLGETAPHWAGYSDPWFGSDKTTWLALMVGRPLMGIRIEDILRAVDFLEESHLLAGSRCAAFAGGAAAIPLLHAAVLDPRIAAVLLEGALESYAAVARTPIHRRIFESMIPGVLGQYDFPDLVAALAPRPAALVNLRTPMGNTAELKSAAAEYAYARSAYEASGAGARLRIGLRREGEPIEAGFPELH